VAIERLKQSTTAESALRAVRNAILDGTFPPGSQLREVHIATELGTSRAPLREALNQLEREGLVVRVPFSNRMPSSARCRTSPPPKDKRSWSIR